MFDELLEMITDSREQQMLLDEIEVIRRSQYLTNKDALENSLKTQVRAEQAKTFRLLLAGVSTDEIEKWLDELKKKVLSISVVEVDLPFDPTEEFIVWLRDWLGKALGQRVLVRLTFKPSLAAGLVMSYRGKYYDWSLAQQFNQSFNKAVEEAVDKVLGHETI